MYYWHIFVLICLSYQFIYCVSIVTYLGVGTVKIQWSFSCLKMKDFLVWFFYIMKLKINPVFPEFALWWIITCFSNICDKAIDKHLKLSDNASKTSLWTITKLLVSRRTLTMNMLAFQKFVTDLSASQKRMEALDTEVKEFERQKHSQIDKVKARQRKVHGAWDRLNKLKEQKERSLQGKRFYSCINVLFWLMKRVDVFLSLERVWAKTNMFYLFCFVWYVHIFLQLFVVVLYCIKQMRYFFRFVLMIDKQNKNKYLFELQIPKIIILVLQLCHTLALFNSFLYFYFIFNRSWGKCMKLIFCYYC